LIDCGLTRAQSALPSIVVLANSRDAERQLKNHRGENAEVDKNLIGAVGTGDEKQESTLALGPLPKLRPLTGVPLTTWAAGAAPPSIVERNREPRFDS